MKSKIIFILLVLSSLTLHAQTLTGIVIDAKTKVPLESVSIYFDNTTIGTTTNENGEFSITYNKAVQSDLIISFLGYEKQYISDYRSKKNVSIVLVESTEQLSEVIINTNDGLTRKQKLKIFRAQFLGTSKYGRKSKILNEDVLILKYNKKGRQLSVSAIAPLEIENEELKYHITYDLVDFEVIFNYVELFKNDFSVYSTFYSGSSFYKDEMKDGDKGVMKQREKAYKGSIQHFMRAIYNERLKEEKYKIFKRGFGVKESAHIFVEKTSDPDYKKVRLSGKLTVLYKGKAQSDIFPKTEAFYVDQYGNFLPVRALFFNGEMGSMRVGDTLPLDYNLQDNSKNNDEKFITGTWHVVAIEKLPKEKPYSLMIDSFKEARFVFNKNKTCKLESSSGNSLFSIMASVVNTSKWNLLKNENDLILQILNKESNLMNIKIKIIEKDVFFEFGKKGETSPFLLKVEKQ